MEPTKLQRKVEPKGHLLSDNDTGVDHLGYSIYADALARLLFWVQTPITVGVFAPWGSGKSFLLREVRYLLQKYQNQKEIDHNFGDENFSRRSKRSKIGRSTTTQNQTRRQGCTCAAWTFFLLSIICLLIATLLIALDPAAQHIYYEDPGNSTDSPSSDTPLEQEEASIGFLAVVILLSLIGIVFVTFVCCVSTTDTQCWAKTSRNFRLVAYAMFTTLPTLGEKRRTAQADYDIVIDFDEDAELALMDPQELAGQGSQTCLLKTKYIFVNFKAWEYAGSDTLWAGIVTNLTQAIEAEFGVVTSRLFRMLDIEEVLDDSKCREPSSVGVLIRDFDVTVRSVKRMMTQYGVVIKVDKRGSWWTVRYSSSIEARNALKSLRIAGFDARLSTDTPVEPANAPDKISPQAPTSNCQSKVVSIEMDNLVPDPDSTSISSRDIRWSAHPKPASFFSHFLKYPKKVCCGCPFLYFCILFIIAVVLFPIGVCILVSELRLDILRSTRAIPVEVQILAWMPATAAALLVIMRFCYAMFKSQTRRVNQALSGAKGNMAAELGFMSKVKDEIKVIEKLVRCLRFTHQQNYKIIISIDDLDRCPHEKVKSVLEAVSILLSDRCSPFVCLIALDSRVAVKCIEEGMGNALLKANVNGHEYLKKIINLPFCLPELSSRDKRRYFAGMMDQADRTKLVRKSPERGRPNSPKASPLAAGDLISSTSKGTNFGRLGDQSTTAWKEEPPKDVDVGSRSSSGTDAVDACPASSKHIDEKEFLYKCRQFLHDDETLKYHLAGNPRNMKRIFNVISMTTHLIQSLQAHDKRSALINKWLTNSRDDLQCPAQDEHDVTWRLSITADEEGARDLVRWVVLTDQWPYRMSYLLQVIEDADQRSNSGRRSEVILDQQTLLDIYENIVIPEINANLKVDESTLLSLDGDPDLFLGLLGCCKLTKRRALQLKNVTVNLDQSLRQNIALYRSLVDIQKGDSGTENRDLH
uniref:Uncharacterized protein LOC100178218 n=1 Tax=Phallusia mammillata TaxID=59560 RepID=A0A6F9DG35_9ASCI|nr:uncharacterized protein LOC100178218 [Phallusia mammillata]